MILGVSWCFFGVLGGSWWFLAIVGGFWWFLAVLVIFGGWFLMGLGGGS